MVKKTDSQKPQTRIKPSERTLPEQIGTEFAPDHFVRAKITMDDQEGHTSRVDRTRPKRDVKDDVPLMDRIERSRNRDPWGFDR